MKHSIAIEYNSPFYVGILPVLKITRALDGVFTYWVQKPNSSGESYTRSDEFESSYTRFIYPPPTVEECREILNTIRKELENA